MKNIALGLLLSVAPAQALSQIPDSALVCRRNISEVIIHCFVIALDGTVEPGRPLDMTGAHCIGHNRRSIGICYVGGLDAAGHPADTRTPAQRRALAELLARLRPLYPEATVHGHREFDAKAEYSVR